VVTSRVAELGEVVASGGPVVVIADLRSVWLRVYVPEARYGAIRLGLGAEAAVDSHPGVRFQGRATEIASEAEFTPRNVQTQQERVKLVFGVKVSLDNPHGKLKPGMPADALIRVR
jgi:HlyD family secretion protein